MSDTITETVQAIREMDSVTQTIFLAGIRAMKAGRLTPDTFEDRVTALVMCHRAGGGGGDDSGPLFPSAGGGLTHDLFRQGPG